jgi:phospholipid-binding lipoprotein MlaA
MDRRDKTTENRPNSKGAGRMIRAAKAPIVGICGLVLTACASMPPSPQALAANDPYEQTNRQTLIFNGKIDRYVVVPSFAVYFVLVPEAERRGVHNFLGNLSLPTIFVNDMLQGELTRGSQSAERFLINSSLGIGGFFDPAKKMGIPAHGEDFGQTLAVWGVGEGPYLVLPFIGPANPRDAAGLATDVAIDPTNFIPIKQHLWWSATREYFTLLDLKGQTYQTIQGIQRSSVDYYASLRSLYRQLRETEIRNGRAPATQDLPEF